jgi:hypothetical protein
VFAGRPWPIPAAGLLAAAVADRLENPLRIGVLACGFSGVDEVAVNHHLEDTPS